MKIYPLLVYLYLIQAILKTIFSLFLLFLSLVSYSQSFKISGTLVDAEDQSPLEAATVFMETASDSTLITYTITDKNGKFTLEGNTSVKKVRVNISFVGYESFQKVLELNAAVTDVGKISLQFSVSNLDEVVVKSRAPVTIKKDTLEFNVASFKTKKDATIEDLLKELPGVEVDADGKIKVNGKDVSNVLVNGKPFFGDDPTIATRNLTKEIIEKVQVVDTKSKAEAFTGEEGNKESKTINLTIKEENNKGIFGRVAAGGGTDERFEYAGLFNYFDNDRRISLLAGGNNINSPGFSFGEIQKMFGGRSMTRSSTGAFSIDGRSFGFGEGIVNSRIAGANYADVIKEKTDVSADYFYSSSNSLNESKTQRENLLPDRRYFTESKSYNESDTESHTINSAFDIKIDSTLLINIKPQFSYNQVRGDRRNSSLSRNENLVLTNQAVSEAFKEMNSRKFANELTVTKNYGSGGGFIRIGLENEINNEDGDDFLYSETNIYGDIASEEIRNQNIDSDNSSNNIVAYLDYRIPLLSKKLFLKLNYELEHKKDVNTRSVFDFDGLSDGYSNFNTLFSTDYTFKNSRKTPSFALNYISDKVYLQASVGYVFQNLKGWDKLRPTLEVDTNYNDVEASVNGSYNISASSRIYGNYNYNSSAPAIIQLLPYTDVTNSLNIITGNPNLKPTSTHNLYFNYNNYNYQQGVGFYSYIMSEVYEDAIVTKTTVDENNIRNTTYANVKGKYGLSANFSGSKKYQLDSLWSISPRLIFWGQFMKDVNYNNDILYNSHIYRMHPSVRIDVSWKNILNIRAGYIVSVGRSTYQHVNFEDRSYVSHSLDFRTSLSAPKNFEWQNDIRYQYNPDLNLGFQKNTLFWNTTLSYLILKEKGTLSLKIYDLLNQNTNARRTVSQDFIQDSESTVLRRYAMLGFSYKFNTLGKKGEVREFRM